MARKKYLANANQSIIDLISPSQGHYSLEKTAVVASNAGDTLVPYDGTGICLESPKIRTVSVLFLQN